MQRVRVVIEENRIQAVLRREELRGDDSNYRRLAALRLPQYSGRYQISVRANNQILSVTTSVVVSSGVYLFSFNGEGVWTDFSLIILRSFD